MSVDVYRWRLLWREVFTCGEEARELPMRGTGVGTASPPLAAPLSTESNLSALTPSGQLPTIPLPHLFFPLLWLPGLGMLGTSAPHQPLPAVSIHLLLLLPLSWPLILPFPGSVLLTQEQLKLSFLFVFLLWWGFSTGVDRSWWCLVPDLRFHCYVWCLQYGASCRFCCFVLATWSSMQDLKFLWPGDKPIPLAVEAWSPNHWTVREISCCRFLIHVFYQVKEDLGSS